MASLDMHDALLPGPSLPDDGVSQSDPIRRRLIRSVETGRLPSGMVAGSAGGPTIITIDDFSRIVAGIYNSAVTPENWTAVLGDVRRTLEAQSCALALADGKDRSIRNASVSPEAQKAYGEYYCQVDYVLEAVENGPVGLIRSGRPLVALRAGSEFDADWMRPHQMDDGLFVRLTDGSTSTCFLVAAPQRLEPFDTAERVKLVSALVPHLQQALRTQEHLEDLHQQSNDLREATEVLRHGIAIIGHGSRVVYTNAVAGRMLQSGDGLRTHAGRIEAVAPSADTHLQRSIPAALAPEGADRSGTSFACPRRSGLRPYVVDVVPLERSTDTESPRRAMIVVVDPEDEPEPPAVLLQRLFGLTRSEADTALLVLQGHGLKHISEQLWLSQATVKTHLQHVFDKTGTHRQAELVRLLLTLRPVCR